MALSILQSKKNYDTSSGTGPSSLSAAFDAVPTEGNLLVAFVGGRPDNATGNAPTLAVADTGGAWTSATVDSSTNHTIGIFYKVAGAAHPQTVTLTPTSGGGGSSTTFHHYIYVVEFQGWTGDPTIDVTATADSGGATTNAQASGSTGATAGAGSLAVSLGTLRNGNPISNDASLTEVDDQSVAAGRYDVAWAWGERSDTTALNVTWTKSSGPNAEMVSMVAVFADAGTPATNAPAGHASATASGYAATAASAASAGSASATATAYTAGVDSSYVAAMLALEPVTLGNPDVIVGPVGSSALAMEPITITAPGMLVTANAPAGSASVTATAHNATVSNGVTPATNAPAGHAAAYAAPAFLGLEDGTGRLILEDGGRLLLEQLGSLNATVSNAAATNAAAGSASATATASNPSAAVTVAAGSASSTATAHNATVSTAASTNAPAGHASATATAHNATVEAVPFVTADAGNAAATATGYGATAAVAATPGEFVGLRDTVPVNTPGTDMKGGAAVGGARLWTDPDLGAASPVKWVIDPLHEAVYVPPPLRIVDAGATGTTLQTALNNAEPGDHIRLRPGVNYGTADFLFTVSGTAEAPIVVEQEPGSEWWRTDGGNPATVGSTDPDVRDGGFDVYYVSNIVIRHIKLTNVQRGVEYRGKQAASWTSGPTPGQPWGENIVVLGCWGRNSSSSMITIRGVERQYDPGDYNNARNVIVESNLVERAVTGSNECINAANGVHNCDIRFNIVRDAHPYPLTGREGIDFKDGVQNSRIYGNIVYTLQQRAIYIEAGAGVTGESTPTPWAIPPVVGGIEIFNNYCIGGRYDPSNNTGGTSLNINSEGFGNIDGVKVYNNVFKDTDVETFDATHYPAGKGPYNSIMIWKVTDSPANPGGDQSTIFRGIEIRHNTIINAGKDGIRQEHPDVTDTIIEGNLVIGSNGTHDIYDPYSVAANTKNVAKTSDGVTYAVDPATVTLVQPGANTAEDRLYEPTAAVAVSSPTKPAYLARDFHGRTRGDNWDYGAVQYQAIEALSAAAATASGHSPSAAVTVPAGSAAATASAHDATVTAVPVVTAAAGHASATATGHDATVAATATAGSASATATAHAATVTTSGTTNAPAGHASATATGHAASVTATATAGSATATATAHAAAAASAATAGHAAATATAHNATVTTSSSTNAPAGHASVGATAYNATVATSSSTNAPAGHAAATATAYDATVETVPVVTVTAGHGSATATAYGATVTTSTGATTATVTATAHGATVSTAASTSAAAGHATATATGHDATVYVTVSAGTATATATAYDALVGGLAAAEIRTSSTPWSTITTAATSETGMLVLGAPETQIVGTT